MTSNEDKTKEIIKTFFEKAGFEMDLSVIFEGETIKIKAAVDDPKALIGQNGQTLADIQHLLRAILNHELAERMYVDFDINSYKEKKIAYIKESAREWADDVALNRKEKSLNPMPAFERRIIHLELSGRDDIETESAGEGQSRYIIIKPKG